MQVKGQTYGSHFSRLRVQVASCLAVSAAAGLDLQHGLGSFAAAQHHQQVRDQRVASGLR